MGGLAAAVRFDGEPVHREAVMRMCDAAAHRARDGRGSWAEESAGFGQLAHWIRPEDRGVVDPHVEPAVVVVADCRIDNRADLAARLGADAATTDLQLVAAAYQRWGDHFPAELLGDFALVVWDRTRRRVVCARDPMGMRPLYYRHEPSTSFLAASEVGQILVDPSVPAAVDEVQLAAFLHGPRGFRERSFHRGIDQVVPGEVVVVAGTGPVRRSRYWTPDPERRIRLADEGEYAEALRELLVEAVRVRCEGLRPPAMMLSGGIDSGAVALAAGALLDDGLIEPVPAYTWAFDELRTCDERSVSERIAAHCGLPLTTVPGDDAFPLADHPNVGPALDSPASWPWADLHDRTYAQLGRDGASVVLTAGRGDEVIGDPVWDYAGLLAAGRLRDVHDRLRGTARRAGRPLWRTARQAVALELGRATAHDLPALGPALSGMVDLEDLSGTERARSRALHGRGRRARFGRIFGYAAHQLNALDAREIARHGMVLADPWTDRRIIEWVLSIPQFEVTRPDQPKHLLHAAVEPWMPPDVDFLRTADLAALYSRGLRERSRGLIERLFTSSELAARGYIDPDAYTTMYEELRAGAPRPLFERALAAELWLRRHWCDDPGRG